VYPDVSLKEARDRRDTSRKLLADGIDPSEKRKEMKTAREDRAANSFDVVAREWLAKHSNIWVPNHSKRILRLFERDIFPWLGGRPIADVTAPELLAVVRRIENRGAVETTRKALRSCSQIFRYAVANGVVPAGGGIGFINPYIYPIGLGSSYTSDFHDITTGSNGAYSAATGYDLVTGWGSPNGQNLIDALAQAPPLACTPTFSCSAFEGWRTDASMTLSCNQKSNISVSAQACNYGTGCQQSSAQGDYSTLSTSVSQYGTYGSPESCSYAWSYGGNNYYQSGTP
jgi:hypothetical protein